MQTRRFTQPVSRTRSGFRPGPMIPGAVTLALLLATAGIPSAAPPDLFDELHARIAAAEAKRHTVRARFIETTTSSLLARPIVSRGTLLGSKPASMVIWYTAPEPKTIIMDGAHLAIVRPADGREVIDVTEIVKKVDHYFTKASPDQLRRAFTARALIDPDSPDTYQLDLVPKRKQIKQGLERLQIWVGRASYMLSQMKITFAGGDTTVFRLEGVELNVPVPPNTFDTGAAAAPKTPK